MMKITTLHIKFTSFDVLSIVVITVSEQSGDSKVLIKTSKRLALYDYSTIGTIILQKKSNT
jgi:hypothetical protein